MSEVSDYWKPELQKADAKLSILGHRAGRLEKALRLALARLAQKEPGDSRAVSDEFVAMAAVLSGNENTGLMTIIDTALLSVVV